MMNWKNFFATGVIFCSGIVAAETVTLQTNLLNNADFSAKSEKLLEKERKQEYNE